MRYHSETPCKVCSKQSAAHPETPERVPRGLYHAIMPQQPRTMSAGTDTALSDRPRRNDSAVCNPTATDTDRADQISTERSHQTGAACHGHPAPDFSRLSGQGSVQPVQCSPIAMQGVSFCVFSVLIFLNCAKCLFVETHKTTKTAYLLAFCKYAAFRNNFCRQFLPDFCDLYGL